MAQRKAHFYTWVCLGSKMAMDGGSMGTRGCCGELTLYNVCLGVGGSSELTPMIPTP